MYFPSVKTDPVVVFSHVVRIQGAPWLRLHFGEVQLSGSASAGNESFLRITSEADGAVQVLDPSALVRWGNTSAYFNGEAVVIELFARAGTGANRLLLEKGVAGIQSELDAPASICGPTDDRVPSSDPRAGRIMPAGCSGFLFNQRPNCLLTAGHCADNLSDPQGNLVEFNVPESEPDGTINHPPPQDQYPVDQTSIQFLADALGQDWCQFGAFNNTTTLLSPLRAQGASYRLATTVPPANGSTLRITGYGTYPAFPALPNELNQTQQTHTGAYQQKVGTIVEYVVDTTGGNSGSAVEHLASGLVYAIHTHGFCTPTGGLNAGTAVDHSGLRSALACPKGVCADCNGNGILDQCDLNCASPCGGCNVPGCGGSSDCNSNGVPDECDIDCDFNGVPDECDRDCDEDNIPDECDAGGACCLYNYDCIKTPTSDCCDAAGGVFWYGLGTKCRDIDCLEGPMGPQGP